MVPGSLSPLIALVFLAYAGSSLALPYGRNQDGFCGEFDWARNPDNRAAGLLNQGTRLVPGQRFYDAGCRFYLQIALPNCVLQIRDSKDNRVRWTASPLNKPVPAGAVCNLALSEEGEAAVNVIRSSDNTRLWRTWRSKGRVAVPISFNNYAQIVSLASGDVVLALPPTPYIHTAQDCSILTPYQYNPYLSWGNVPQRLQTQAVENLCAEPLLRQKYQVDPGAVCVYVLRGRFGYYPDVAGIADNTVPDNLADLKEPCGIHILVESKDHVDQRERACVRIREIYGYLPYRGQGTLPGDLLAAMTDACNPTLYNWEVAHPDRVNDTDISTVCIRSYQQYNWQPYSNQGLPGPMDNDGFKATCYPAVTKHQVFMHEANVCINLFYNTWGYRPGQTFGTVPDALRGSDGALACDAQLNLI